MEVLNNDIELGIRQIRGLNGNDNQCYSDVFLHTNELISEHYKELPIANGNILTIASGGDHILQAVCDNPRTIDAFDINKFALYVSKLKVAAMKALSYDEFYKYFNLYNSSDVRMFNRDSYVKFRDCLNDNDKMFWDMMYEKADFQYNYINLILSVSPFDTGNRSYIHEENFYKAKMNLDKVSINYYHSNFLNLLNKLPENKKYDVIFLSNIYDYYIYKESKEFLEIINNHIDNRLTDKGIAVLYSPVCDNEGINIYEGYVEKMGKKLLIYKKCLRK